MARIRTIKPEFWTDDVVGTLSRDARLLFIASWNLADDGGILRWSAPFLKGAVFPYDTDLTVKKIAVLMNELEKCGVVLSYFSGPNKQPLAFIINFRKHQNINRPSPRKFAFPSPEEFADALTSPSLSLSLRESLRSSLMSSLSISLSDSLLEGKGRERKGKEDAAQASAPPSLFENLPDPPSEPPKPPDPEKDLYDRGKDVLGKTAGGMIAKLLKVKNGSVPLARADIERASTKQDAREYISRIIANATGPPTKPGEYYVDPRL